MYAFPLKMANSGVRFQLFENGIFRAWGLKFFTFSKWSIQGLQIRYHSSFMYFDSGVYALDLIHWV